MIIIVLLVLLYRVNLVIQYTKTNDRFRITNFYYIQYNK